MSEFVTTTWAAAGRGSSLRTLVRAALDVELGDDRSTDLLLLAMPLTYHSLRRVANELERFGYLGMARDTRAKAEQLVPRRVSP